MTKVGAPETNQPTSQLDMGARPRSNSNMRLSAMIKRSCSPLKGFSMFSRIEFTQKKCVYSMQQSVQQSLFENLQTMRNFNLKWKFMHPELVSFSLSVHDLNLNKLKMKSLWHR